jgi:N-acetyl-gamma-glutamyl-phosphate reductase
MTSYAAAIAGVTGYTGMELCRILAGHPNIDLTMATSRTEAGKQLQDVYPFLRGLPLGELAITAPSARTIKDSCDLAFLAVPHGAAMDLAAELYGLGLKTVDLSADFRLHDKKIYESWYALCHRHPGLLQHAVYGLPELHGDRIKTARLVANPGCYPTSAILGLAPALTSALIHTGDIVIDAKSGASGAGRKPAQPFLFCEVSDTFRAYSLTKHRHTPEIEQEISLVAGEAITVSFNTHLLPVNRGILSTIYTRLAEKASPERVHELYENFYKDFPFVRVLPLGSLPETRYVRGTMFCDIGLCLDPRTNRLLILTAIDNLCRGASGQAVACANLMLGLPLETGLNFAPLMP